MNLKLFLLPAVIVCMSACSHKVEQQDKKKESMLFTDSLGKVVTLDEVHMGVAANELMLNGRVTFNQEQVAQVYSIFGGNVMNVNAQIGDYVKKGDVLATIKSGEVADYEKQLKGAEQQVTMAKRNLDRMQDLSHSGMASDRELLQAKQDFVNAVADHKRVREVFKIYHIGANSVYRVKAPISGFVVDKKINKDMQLRADQNEDLFTLSGLDNVWVMADIYESDISKVKEGAAVRITTLAYPDKEFTGVIDKVYNILNEESKTMSARIKLRNDHYLLKPGMFADVFVKGQDAGKSMLCLLSKDIIFNGGKQYVVVVGADKVMKIREVEVETQSGKYSYISSGVSEGEKVISKNALLVYNALNVD